MASFRLLALALLFLMGGAVGRFTPPDQNQTAEFQVLKRMIEALKISQDDFQSLMQAMLSSAGYSVCQTYTDRLLELQVEIGLLKSELTQQMQTSASACKSEFKQQTDELKKEMQNLVGANCSKPELHSNMTASQCAAGYHSFGGSCYILIQNEISWMSAKQRCESVGATLVAIDSKEENDFLEKLVQSSFEVDTVIYAKMDIWTGGNDLEKEGTWQWGSTGKVITPGVSFSDWERGQPKRGLFADCLLLQVRGGSSTWYDRPCAVVANYICEKKG